LNSLQTNPQHPISTSFVLFLDFDLDSPLESAFDLDLGPGLLLEWPELVARELSDDTSLGMVKAVVVLERYEIRRPRRMVG
jgi:hypothetical protein